MTADEQLYMLWVCPKIDRSADESTSTCSREVVTMNDNIFKKLKDSVHQADDLIQGKAMPSHVTVFAEPEVKAVRAKTGLTQAGFANVLGVSKRTLENWKTGKLENWKTGNKDFATQ
jgi:putative transcriptional regulator